MSCWSKVGVVIKDLEIFRQCCEQNGVSFERVNINNTQRIQRGMPVFAVLKDMATLPRPYRHDEAYLCISGQDEYQLVIDNDPNWCSITERVGADGGLITRSYSEEMTKRLIRMEGGMINSVKEEVDRSLLIRVSVQ